jgi:hypothetical protein
MKTIKIIIPFLAFFFISCEKEGIEGPNLNDLYGDLTIVQGLEVIGDSTDFSNNESLFFTASFSKIVDWSISIAGQNSGSTKIISGKSNSINEENSSWNGGVTTLPFFQVENCSAVLTFSNHNDTIFKTLNIVSSKNYGNGQELLISDFESGFNPNFTNFFQTTCSKSIETGGAGQKERYLSQEGTCDWDWLIGYIDYPTSHWLQQGVLSADPDNVFFNMMIYGDSTLSPTNEANSLFKLEFYEDENQDSYYNASNEDRLDYEFNVDWNGWKMISIRYSDLILATDPNGGGTGGNAIREPNKIIKIRTLLLANPASGFAKADVDYLIWSEGSPILEQ